MHLIIGRRLTINLRAYKMVWHTLCNCSFEEQIFIKLNKMKKLICTSVLAILIASMTTVRAQDYPEEHLGLPGDNLNLYAVMKLFQDSPTLEAFERDLNSQDSHLNNLDLNGDNLTDYITVTDYVDKDVHTIVLRAVLSKNEYQDVAVFTVQKLKNGQVRIQLIGDEALYGKNYIIEPMYAGTPNPGYTGDAVINNYYETTDWPVVIYIYEPYYSGWHSRWYWGFYPEYWNPWRPWYWDYYYGYHYQWYHDYYARYHHSDHYSYPHYKDYYYDRIRKQSADVAHRISAGSYAGTYSRPDQRKEGEAFYSATHRKSGVRERPANETVTRGESVPVQPSDRRTAPAAGTTPERPSRETTPATVQAAEHRTAPAEAQPAEHRDAPAAVQQPADHRTAPAAGTTPARPSRETAPAVSSSSDNVPERSSSVPAAASRRTEPENRPAVTSRSSEESKPAPAVSSRSSEVSKPAPAASSRSSEVSRPAKAASSSNSKSETRSSAPSTKSSKEAPDNTKPKRR